MIQRNQEFGDWKVLAKIGAGGNGEVWIAQNSKGHKAAIKPVGRESEAHPAISIIPSLDFERYHLPPNQGYKCSVPQIDESLNTANPRPS
jgi:hypothetical protein